MTVRTLFRIIIAFIASVLIPVVVLALVAPKMFIPPMSDTAVAGPLGERLIEGIIFGGLPTIIFGVPAYVLFRKLGWLAWWQVILGAAFSGMLFVLVISGAFYLADGNFLFDFSITFCFALLFGVFGVFAGTLFWLIGVHSWRRSKTLSDSNSVT